MEDRRRVLAAMAAILGTTTATRAWAAPDAPGDDTPKATAIPGSPPVLDFGEGLKVPLSKAAFLTLWEGKAFWITYGYGRSTYALQANGKAVKFAVGSMKLLLLTLAFAPDRLDHVDGCGWRLKSPEAKNYVLGDVDLPGKPFFPVTDANLGFGSADSSVLAGSADARQQSLSLPGAAPAGSSGPSLDMTGTFTKVDAFTAFIVKKKDVDLAYVRANAKLI